MTREEGQQDKAQQVQLDIVVGEIDDDIYEQIEGKPEVDEESDDKNE